MDKKRVLSTIRFLRSKEKLLPSEEADLATVKSKKIPYTKDGLQTLLANSIMLIEYQKADYTRDWILCTSHTAIIKIFNMKKESDMQKVTNFSSDGISCKEDDRVLTWDLIDNKLKTVLVRSWEMKMVILVKPDKENVFAIDRILKTLLK